MFISVKFSTYSVKFDTFSQLLLCVSVDVIIWSDVPFVLGLGLGFGVCVCEAHRVYLHAVGVVFCTLREFAPSLIPYILYVAIFECNYIKRATVYTVA